ncbi:MAG TPA: serine/threonine-protein kinase [Polyangiaceae bacterium]|jgi:serine/threonine-protein kinase
MSLAQQAGAAFPERLGRYEILSPIAQGGMSQVFLGRIVGPRGFERDVAIKLLYELGLEAGSSDPLAEAKLAGQIRHPNVVPVFDVGSAEDGFFLVMEYVEGDSLAALQREAGEPLPVPIALKILTDALSGLDAAHELADSSGRNLGVVHRDFSPQNILVGVDGIARLSDFGIAKAAIREGETQTGIVKGKVGYMSPEQATGKALDRRCDVWAAGVVAWETFAGQRLYAASGDPVATAVEIVTGEPRALAEANPSIPAQVASAVHYALAKDVDRRCPSARAYRECLLQAWGVSPASATDVAHYVRKLVGDKLETRRANAERVLELRRRAVSTAGAEPRPKRSAPSSSKLGGLKWALLVAAAGALALYRSRASNAQAQRVAPSAQQSSSASEPAPLASPSVAANASSAPLSPQPPNDPGAQPRKTTLGAAKRGHSGAARVVGDPPGKSPPAATLPPAPRPAASNPYE